MFDLVVLNSRWVSFPCLSLHTLDFTTMHRECMVRSGVTDPHTPEAARKPVQRRGGLSMGSQRSYVHQKEVRDAQPLQEGDFSFTEYCDFSEKREIGIFLG